MFLDLLDLFADPTWSCRGQWIKLGPNCKEEKTVKLNPVTLVIIFTGRNEVVAKVIVLHRPSFCSQGGGLPQFMLGYHQPPPPGADSGIRSMSDQYASYWNAFLLAKRS